MISNPRKFYFNVIVFYFAIFLFVIGPIAGYIFALYQNKSYLSFPKPEEKTNVAALMDRNTPLRDQMISESKKCIPQKIISSDESLRNAIAAFSTSTLSQDGRILVSRTMLNQLFETQDATPTLFTEGWNVDAPDEWVSYSNKDFGINSMKIPYNHLWGNRTFAVMPYEWKSNRGLLFGSVGPRIEDYVIHNWPISFTLTVVAKQDVRTLDGEKSHVYPEGLTIEKINGHDVAYGKTWIDYAGFYPVIYEIAGSKFNYRISPGVEIKTDEKVIRKIIEQLYVE